MEIDPEVTGAESPEDAGHHPRVPPASVAEPQPVPAADPGQPDGAAVPREPGAFPSAVASPTSRAQPLSSCPPPVRPTVEQRIAASRAAAASRKRQCPFPDRPGRGFSDPPAHNGGDDLLVKIKVESNPSFSHQVVTIFFCCAINGWIRNLVADGDVESNPGPPKQSTLPFSLHKGSTPSQFDPPSQHPDMSAQRGSSGPRFPAARENDMNLDEERQRDPGPDFQVEAKGCSTNPADRWAPNFRTLEDGRLFEATPLVSPEILGVVQSIQGHEVSLLFSGDGLHNDRFPPQCVVYHVFNQNRISDATIRGQHALFAFPKPLPFQDRDPIFSFRA